ncbi:Cystatin domain-containing protein [Plasmodiophora brassicae]
MVVCGGRSDAMACDENAAKVAHAVRDGIASKAGVVFDRFEPVAYRRQVVAGLNYFFKVRVSGANDGFVHATVWMKPGGSTVVTDATAGHVESDDF